MCTLLVGNICVGMARIITPHLGYWTLVVQVARSVRRSLFIVFFINLVNFSPAENPIVYITCGYCVLVGEYKSVAIAGL